MFEDMNKDTREELVRFLNRVRDILWKSIRECEDKRIKGRLRRLDREVIHVWWRLEEVGNTDDEAQELPRRCMIIRDLGDHRS